MLGRDLTGLLVAVPGFGLSWSVRPHASSAAVGAGQVVPGPIDAELGGPDVLGARTRPQVVEAAPRRVQRRLGGGDVLGAGVRSAEPGRGLVEPEAALRSGSAWADASCARVWSTCARAWSIEASRPAASSGFGPASSASTRDWAWPTCARAAAISSTRAPDRAWSSRASAERTAAAAASMSSALRAGLDLREPGLGDADRRLGLLHLGVECRAIQLGDHLALPDLVADVDVEPLDAPGDLRHHVDLRAGLDVTAVHQRRGDVALSDQRAAIGMEGGVNELPSGFGRLGTAAVQLTSARTTMSSAYIGRRWRPDPARTPRRRRATE